MINLTVPLDAMGEGFFLRATVPALLQALLVNSQCKCLLVVNPDAIMPLLIHTYPLILKRLQVVPAEHVIACDAKLLQATHTIQGSPICIAS